MRCASTLPFRFARMTSASPSTPWVHLDIAGTAWLDEKKPWAASGPTGVAIRTLIDFALKM